MAQLETFNGPIIRQGQAYSDVLDLGNFVVVGLATPPQWTPGVVSITISPDGDNFYDVFDYNGSELLFNIVPETMIAVAPDLLLCARYLRLRSGTRERPVEQEAQRLFHTIGSASVYMQSPIQQSKREDQPC